MRFTPDGKYFIELDNRLLELTKKERELKVTEDDFKVALKGYRLDEFLIVLADISAKLFDRDFQENQWWKKEKKGFIIHKITQTFVTDSAVEYITNILLVSGSNNFKSESIKNKENILGVFGIYNNFITRPTGDIKNLASFLVPMYFQQLSSQRDHKDSFVRQWLIFQKAQELVRPGKKIDLDKILLEKTGMSVMEFIKLCFLIFAAMVASPRFNFGKFENSTISGMDDVLNKEKISAILKQLSATKEQFIELDQKYNAKLRPLDTLNRYNPLWEKPVIVLGDNDYIVPSFSAFMKGALQGLYWVFENAIGKTFRDYFGNLFEIYSGMVIKDIFGEKNVTAGLRYGKNDNNQFFDWIVNSEEEIILFEIKGYQFPLKTLQTGDPDLITKEVVEKIVETIKQMYERFHDIQNFEELKGFKDKKITVIAVFYDIPLISTDLYDSQIKLELANLESTHPGIKDFAYIFLSIEELENYSYVQKYISIPDLVRRVKADPGAGVLSETSKVYKESNAVPNKSSNLLDKKFKEFYTNELRVSFLEEEDE